MKNGKIFSGACGPRDPLPVLFCPRLCRAKKFPQIFWRGVVKMIYVIIANGRKVRFLELRGLTYFFPTILGCPKNILRNRRYFFSPAGTPSFLAIISQGANF